MKKEEYEKELRKLQIELVKLQEWVKHEKAKVVIVFEGRDAAGKGGLIRRITERVSPRVFHVIALPAPSDREKTQLYMQRYISNMPAGGEITLFDRSWYNRAGVEHVMGFCTEKEYEDFIAGVPNFEAYLVRSGIILLKYFLTVSPEEQEKRFLKRINDPLRQWKLSGMDLESYRLWWEYTDAIDRYINASSTEYAPWFIAKSDDKEKCRLNVIRHILDQIPYKEIKFDKPELPKRKKKREDIVDKPLFTNYIPDVY